MVTKSRVSWTSRDSSSSALRVSLTGSSLSHGAFRVKLGSSVASSPVLLLLFPFVTSTEASFSSGAIDVGGGDNAPRSVPSSSVVFAVGTVVVGTVVVVVVSAVASSRFFSGLWASTSASMAAVRVLTAEEAGFMS